MIARADGLTIVGYPEDLSDAAVGRKLPPERLLNGATGRPVPFVYVSDADRIRRVGAARWVSGFPVLVQVGLPAGQPLATWRRTVLGEGALLAAALAAVVGLGHLAARRATREEKLAAELEGRVETRTAELQEALAAKEVLLREVNHRVTNNLQLVSSLLGMQRSRAASEEVRRQLEDTRARIHSIAGLHRALYANGSHDAVDMPAYLGAIAGDIANSLGRDGAPRPVLVEAEPLRLPADAAVLLGLIANELATNAIKHAYAAGEEGPVTIRLRAEAGRVRLEVADGGRGLAPGYDPAAGGGLGMRLVLALTRQLRGTLTAGDAAPGALFAVELPFPGGPPQASTNATA